MRPTSPADRGRARARARRQDGLRADATQYPGLSRDPTSNFWYSDPEWGGAGVVVTPDSALASGVVFRAAEIIANAVAQLEPEIYREDATGEREVSEDSPLYRLLSRRPNAWQSPFEFRQMLTAQVALGGNAYARIIQPPGEYVTALVPFPSPSLMKVEQLDTTRLRYTYARPGAAQPERYSQDEILHLRGWSRDGIVGMSRVAKARTTIGLALGSERFAADAYSRAPKMAGFIEWSGKFKDEAQQRRVEESFRARSAGRENHYAVPILDQGMSFKAAGMSFEDAEFLASRKFSVVEQAAWFGVPASLVGGEAAAGNAEQETLNLLVHCLMAYVEIWEGAIERDLILDDAEECEFDVLRLLRADLAAQTAYLTSATGRRAWLTPNEARQARGLPRIDDDPEMDKVHEGLGSTLGAPKPDAKSTGAQGGNAQGPKAATRSRRLVGANRLNGHPVHP